MSWHTRGETQEGRHGAECLFYAAAGALLLICWALLWLVGKPIWIPLAYVGWALLVAGLALIAFPLLLLPKRGKAPQGGGVTQTTVVVRSGLYGVIRHPLYLGWILVFFAMILIAQHWLVVLLAVPGVVCTYLITIQEERRLVSRFGEEYVRYIKDVPRLNVLAGVVRMARRGRTR
jgi:protein-S-isoprenylcysteine O-methyltransferase Ste14